jgi:hypothetical protein
MTEPARKIDWSQLWYPGPRRPFSAEEMARAGGDGPGPTLVAAVLMNAALLGIITLQLAPAAHAARLAALWVALSVAGLALARWLWWRPWRRPLLLATLAVVFGVALLALGIRWRLPEREDRMAIAVVVGGVGAILPVLLWFLVVWRAQQIGGRLREQAERERAVEMARRLAGAQLEPHFLFNTLASLQHWVQTRDERAAPLLAALTGYLRATLPLFRQTTLAAGDELLAVQRYLEVMQLRLGERLAFSIDVPEALRAQPLPPGALLTLVENAVIHGIEPQLRGGRVQVRGVAAAGPGARSCFEVVDDGAGCADPGASGTGLANVRERLQLLFGHVATLRLQPAPGGGCVARIELPPATAGGTGHRP